MNVKLMGMISSFETMKPTKRIVERDGKKKTYYSFKMSEFGAGEGTEAIQVFINDDERGQKLFESLSSGRRVLVEGWLTQRPNSTVKDNNIVTYVNNIVNASRITFLDQPKSKVFESILSGLEKDKDTDILGKLINDIKCGEITEVAQLKEFLVVNVTEYLKVKFESGRRIIDETAKENKNPLTNGCLAEQA